MAAVARTRAILKGKDVIVLIEKVAGSGTYVAYGCMTSANITNPGIEIEETSCRAGTFKEAAGDAGLPTIAMESLYRYPQGDAATSVSDDEIYDWVLSGETKNVKLQFGINIGDRVLTGPGFFNAQTVNGPQAGNATGGVTFNFSQQPTKSTIAA